MSRLAYFDCPTGIAGDMCLGALIDAGVPLSYLRTQLARLGLAQEYTLEQDTVQHQGQRATRATVKLSHPVDTATAAIHHHSARHLPEIEQLITTADLPAQATQWSLAIFRRLAEAEAAVHGVTPEQVHFHEVGAVDAIVDIVGTCLGLEWLGVTEIYCSALPTGGGLVRAAHGQLPVPVPAVLQLWQQRQVPIYDNGIQRELVTPTGAAIATTLATAFGPPPPMVIAQVGLGAGTLALPIPNCLRLWLGAETTTDIPSPAQEMVAVLETQIDDLSPQVTGYACSALYEAGALEVFTQAIGMKKSRPGILLSVICPLEKMIACETILFQETTTLGIRRSLQQRTVLHRVIDTIQTDLGSVKVKVAYHGKTVVNVQPEYEDCAQLARTQNMPLQEVQRLAWLSWYQEHHSL